MENKYYIPNIEDIRVGYYGEYNNWGIDERGLSFNVWDEAILSKIDVEVFLKYGIKNFRVPFLTKKQIEAEGWQLDTVITTDDDDNDLYNTGFSKYLDENNWYSIVLYPENKILIQKGWYRNEVTWLSREVFYGECKSINEFRCITQKFLKIKKDEDTN